jgi:hypothetical protein
MNGKQTGRRCLPRVWVVCYKEGTAGTGKARLDLDFSHVAADVKGRLSPALRGQQDKVQMLQAW